MAVEAEHDFWGAISAIAALIVGLGTVAVIVSRNSQTSSVISASGSAFTNALSVALSPVTGASYGGSANFPIG